MNELDTETKLMGDEFDEDEMFMQHVIDGDHELLYLDSYLTELFKHNG